MAADAPLGQLALAAMTAAETDPDVAALPDDGIEWFLDRDGC
jgi:hypothetical protein